MQHEQQINSRPVTLIDNNPDSLQHKGVILSYIIPVTNLKASFNRHIPSSFSQLILSVFYELGTLGLSSII